MLRQTCCIPLLVGSLGFSYLTLRIINPVIKGNLVEKFPMYENRVVKNSDFGVKKIAEQNKSRAKE